MSDSEDDDDSLFLGIGVIMYNGSYTIDVHYISIKKVFTMKNSRCFGLLMVQNFIKNIVSAPRGQRQNGEKNQGSLTMFPLKAESTTGYPEAGYNDQVLSLALRKLALKRKRSTYSPSDILEGLMKTPKRRTFKPRAKVIPTTISHYLINEEMTQAISESSRIKFLCNL